MNEVEYSCAPILSSHSPEGSEVDTSTVPLWRGRSHRTIDAWRTFSLPTWPCPGSCSLTQITSTEACLRLRTAAVGGANVDACL
jgi:hypothetical protein